MLPDLDFYLIAIPAVLLVGLSKGGMGEALSLMGVPILSMAVSPVQAAALLLPILIAMDLVSLWMWRKHGDRKTLFMLLPGAIAGIVIDEFGAAWVRVKVVKPRKFADVAAVGVQIERRAPNVPPPSRAAGAVLRLIGSGMVPGGG